MKALIFSVLSLCATGFVASAQNIWLVDNTANRPAGGHVFTTIQAAHDTASAGDIIHIRPSQTQYANFTITKSSLSFYGIGFNPDKDIPIISDFNSIYISGTASNIRISGLRIDYIYLAYASGSTISDIQIDNCIIDYRVDSYTSSRTTDNLLIRNNIFKGDTYPLIDLVRHPVTNAIITNNIIERTSYEVYGTIYANGALIKNNLFISESASAYEAFEDLTNCTVSNNIFFGISPQNGNISAANVFNNNLSYSTANDSLPPAGTGSGNTGSNNLQGMNPMFTNLPFTSDFLFSYDLTPQAGSPVINAGTDGTNIGPTGGTVPFDMRGVVLPLIQSLDANDVVKQGDNLNVNVKARSDN